MYILETKDKSWAIIEIQGRSGKSAEVEIQANSQLLISELVMDASKGTEKTLLDLSVGKILIKAEELHDKDSKFEVQTPTSIVGVRGTTFAVEVEPIE